MGGEESKLEGIGVGVDAASFSSKSSYSYTVRPWALLHECTLNDWKQKYSDKAGFAELFTECNGVLYKDCSPAFCTTRQGVININKTSSIFSFRRKSKFTKMAEHFEYNHIPAQLSSIQNFHVKSVLSHRKNSVVLHLVRNKTTQFGLIDLSGKKFQGIFGKQSVEFINEAVLGEISPDVTLCLIQIPANSPGVPTHQYVFQMYDLKTKNVLIEITLPHGATHFTFDPRFNSSRLSVTNYKLGEPDTLSLVRTDHWTVIATSPPVEGFSSAAQVTVRDLSYSRDGLLVFAILVSDAQCQCKEKKSRRRPVECSVYVFNADTSDTLHCIQYFRYLCSVHTCLANYLPSFSHCSRRMALVLNNALDAVSTDYIHVYQLPNPSISLQHICRAYILQYFAPEYLTKLPLPIKLIDYLQFKPEYT